MNIDIKVTIRRLLKQKIYTIINVIGLTISFACLIFILFWISNELNNDDWIDESESVFRLIQKVDFDDRSVKTPLLPLPLAPVLKTRFAGIEKCSRVHYSNDMLFSFNNRHFNENRILIVDPDFIDIISLKLQSGDRLTALSSPFSAVISRKTALKYFGTVDPVGNTLIVDNKYEINVAGVFNNLPENSIFDFEILFPASFLKTLGYDLTAWHQIDAFQLYIKLRKNINVEQFCARIANELTNHVNEHPAELSLQPLKNIYLDTGLEYDDIIRHGSKQNILFFTLISAAIVLLACFNFINLFTARFIRRTRDICMRKILGAGTSDILKTVITESVLLIFTSLIFALILAVLLFPVYNQMLGKEISLLNGSGVLMIVFGAAIVSAVIVNVYPGMLISSYSPLKLFRSSGISGKRHSFYRKTLIIFQFSISLILMINTLMMLKQLNFLERKDPGFNMKNIVAVTLGRTEGHPVRGTTCFRLIDELIKYPETLSITGASHRPTSVFTSLHAAGIQGTDKEVFARWYSVLPGYTETLGINIKEGNGFRPNNDGQLNDNIEFLVNEAFVRQLHNDDVIGKEITYIDQNGKIVGVVEDFNYRSFRGIIEPMVISANPMLCSNLLIRIDENNAEKALENIREVWSMFAQAYTLEYRFLNDEFDNLYSSDKYLGKLFLIFSTISIIISCLGLFGLVTFITETKRKDAGIRKVFGASNTRIAISFSKEFLICVFPAIVVALPVSWMIINVWMNNFAYSIGFDWPIFIISGIITFVISGLAVSSQIFKAAKCNPVDSLQHD